MERRACSLFLFLSSFFFHVFSSFFRFLVALFSLEGAMNGSFYELRGTSSDRLRTSAGIFPFSSFPLSVVQAFERKRISRLLPSSLFFFLSRHTGKSTLRTCGFPSTRNRFSVLSRGETNLHDFAKML